MSDSPVCLNARAALVEIHSLKDAFDSAFQTAIESGSLADITRAENLKLSLEAAITNLQETIAGHEAERLFELRRQYNDQISLLKKAKLIESRTESDSSGEKREVYFMTGIDKKEYPLPSYETIARSILERKELFEMKADQGFKKLLLVPFGMSLKAMIEKLKAFLIANKNNIPQFDKTKPALDEDEPVCAWGEYNEGDISGDMIYYPTKLSDADHGGQTKQKILDSQRDSKDQNQNQAAGWNILLLQEGEGGKGIRGIPRAGNGEPVGDQHPRPDIESGEKPIDYIAAQLSNANQEASPYRGEQGMVPEDWIAALMTHLEETEQLMDDRHDDISSMAYLTGALLRDHGYALYALWNRRNRHVYLGGSLLGNRGHDEGGVRFAVNVFGRATKQPAVK